MPKPFTLLARVLAPALISLLATLACAADVGFAAPEDKVQGHGDVTYLDLVRHIVPDLAMTGGAYQGHSVVDLRHIGGSEDAGRPPQTIGLSLISATSVRSAGRDRLLLLFDLGGAADSPEGFAVLALYDLSAKPRLLDAANVAYDRSTYFRDPAALAVAGGTDVVFTMSAHFNSNQGYVTTALILPRNDRLELVDTIFTFDEQLCAFRREQIPSFRAAATAAGSFAEIEATVTETTVPSDESCDGEQKPAATTRSIAVTYVWDDATARYAPDSDALKKLAAENATRF